ncbi:P-loop containing nucleoside triphosphate hydrolase protein, partial [Russula aff. rugulosa BPL654]
LAVVGAFIAVTLFGFLIGWWSQKKQRRSGAGYVAEGKGQHGGFAVEWSAVNYVMPRSYGSKRWLRGRGSRGSDDDKVILDGISGRVEPGQLLGILGPSGAGKTTLIEVLANKNKTGYTSGSVRFPSDPSRERRAPRIGFVPQQDVLPAMLTVREAILFAARLRLPEYVTEAEKRQRADDVIEQLGLSHVRDSRIGGRTTHTHGISGGETRRVTIGLELVASPDVLILDEPTSGLDSVSASKVVSVLHALAHDADNPTAVIATIHQPSSQIYRVFDRIVLLSGGRCLYEGPGGFAPAEYFETQGSPCAPGYNVADHLLDLAHMPPPALAQAQQQQQQQDSPSFDKEFRAVVINSAPNENGGPLKKLASPMSAAAFLTQLEVLAAESGKFYDDVLPCASRDIRDTRRVRRWTVFQTGVTIAGFQSRVGVLFFLGSLIALSSLSALHNVLATRPLFVRERSNAYYSPTAWLLVRVLFDIIPLRVIPTIIVATITYWMGGLAHTPPISSTMALFNFLLGSAITDGNLAILLSALSGLYQMTYAGFFVHLNTIPEVLRWLQWMDPLKYALEALTVNEVNSGLQIKDVLQGVPVDVSASLIMHLLFGFTSTHYYRDVLVLFAFIAGFGVSVVAVVWIWVRETR